MDLKNKVILITGAGKGRGRTLAHTLAAHGATLALNDISPINVEEVAAEITRNGGRAKTYVEDIAKKVGAQAVVKDVEDDFGRIDILIHHAAVAPRTPLLQLDEWDWHRTLDVNLTGAFLMLQSTGRIMKAQGSGVIICLGAEAGTKVEQEAGAYFASKAGLQELAHQAAAELHPLGIWVFAAHSAEEVIQRLEEA